MPLPTSRRRRRFARVIAFLALATCVVSGTIPAYAADAEPTTFTGSVIDSDGRPVVGAFVELQRPGVDTLVGSTLTTDASGRFEMTSNRSGTFTLKASCRSQSCVGSYLTRWLGDRPTHTDATTFELQPGTPVTGLDITLPAGAVVSGVVTTTDGAPLEGASVRAYPPGQSATWTPAASASTNARGEYTLKSLAPGSYVIEFSRSVPDRVYLTQYWPGVEEEGDAETVRIEGAEELSGFDATILRSSRIDGAIVDEQGSPLGWSWVAVTLFRVPAVGEPVGVAQMSNEHAGVLWFRGLPPGSYRLCFDPYWTAAMECSSAEPILGPLIDLQPEEAKVVAPVIAGAPVQLTGPVIEPHPAVGSVLDAGVTSTTPGAVIAYSWYADGAPIAGATDQTLKVGVELVGARITARVRATAPGRYPRVVESAQTSEVAEGTIASSMPTVTGLPLVGATLSVDPGAWTPEATLSVEWKIAPNGPTLGTGSSIVLDEQHVGRYVSVTVTGSMPGYTTVSRTRGLPDPIGIDRVDAPTPVITGSPVEGSTLTAATTSATPGAWIVYSWFADGEPVPAPDWGELELTSALVGKRISVRATAFAPLHLTTESDLSRPTEPISAFAAGSVLRLAGADRYQTAASISRGRYSPGVPVVYIANGGNFPDALSAGPLAATESAPLLLTTTTSLPDVIRAELRRLQPERIVVLGSTAAVSAGVAAELAALSSTRVVERIAGEDRYATAVAVSKVRYEDHRPSVVFLASGERFPDALAGTPAVALHDGPLLLTLGAGLPSSTAAELRRLDPDRIVVLGGTPAVSDAVVRELAVLGDALITRVEGDDRFATAALISQSWFNPTTEWTPGISTVFITSGLNFPDALAGAPVAGMAESPLLLTAPDFLPASVVAELQRLHPERIVVLGGPPAVSDAVLAELAAFVG